MKTGEYSLDFAALGAGYASGELTPLTLVEEVWRRCEAQGDPALWIHRLTREELREHARRVEAKGREHQPLYGLPFAIKDNIDLAGVPTTAGCAEFATTPKASAPVVACLMEAGAIPVGKTNLDQFATGLVGTRSPYGTPRNPFHPDYIPGGSSSGSAVAVATGLVSFALGTDTAGSGRVPAAFNNLVGLKPTRGWLSTRGVVPACRSLDCLSIFALRVEDAAAVARLAGIFDSGDPYARRSEFPTHAGGNPTPFRFGIPAPKDLEWFGDPLSPAAFGEAVCRLEGLGGTRVEIDFGPFRSAAKLLYDGPWVAERWIAIREFHGRQADAILPVTRRIIERAATYFAADAFSAMYELASLRRQTDAVWLDIDALVLPTAPTIYTCAQVEADPIALNSRLGLYTNFANLLDCAALAVPADFRSDGLPFGITFFGPAWSDWRLAALGAAFHEAIAPTLGATGVRSPEAMGSEAGKIRGAPQALPPGREEAGLGLAVVGAHLRGQPLNHELARRGARFVRTARTIDSYRLYALSGTTPPKPGLIRRGPGEGAPIEVEIWTLPPAGWGDFVSAIPPPLGIGSLWLEDGSKVKGFLCEPAALEGAEDITRFGGWRAYLQSLKH
jgi:allophanate hydrolase